jgi:hypothetical protein
MRKSLKFGAGRGRVKGAGRRSKTVQKRDRMSKKEGERKEKN